MCEVEKWAGMWLTHTCSLQMEQGGGAPWHPPPCRMMHVSQSWSDVSAWLPQWLLEQVAQTCIDRLDLQPPLPLAFMAHITGGGGGGEFSVGESRVASR